MFLYFGFSVLLSWNLVFAKTSFRTHCPDASPQINCSVPIDDIECINDDSCSFGGQICCHNGCKYVCKNPVYYKALCPEDDAILHNGEWTKFCMGDCNCPRNMACCSGPCTTKICRISNNKRVDCPAPETYNCVSNNPEINSCSAHTDCIASDQLCCPDDCNNKYCQTPDFHEGSRKVDEVHPESSNIEISPKISPKISPRNDTTIEKSSNDNSSTCNPLTTCFDISLTLQGESLESFFPLHTVFIQNTAEKCAALCQLWGYTRIAISTEIGCFCFNGDLDRLTCKTEESCSFKCPGGGNKTCGGLFPNYVNIYRTDIISPADAKSVFPSGMCYKANTTKNGLTADDLPKISNLTPTACKVECGHRGYPVSCTFTGNTCGCYKAVNKPKELSPFQEYCNAKCTGSGTTTTTASTSNGITCGGQQSPALAVINCLFNL